jgi:hypothetical protein
MLTARAAEPVALGPREAVVLSLRDHQVDVWVCSRPSRSAPACTAIA